MKKTFFFALLASLTCLQCNPPSKDKPGGDSATAKADEPAETIKKLDYYAQDKTLKEVIAAEFAAGRTPIVYFWANWCGPCKEFKRSLSDPLMQDALKNVTLIMLDTDVDDQKEKHGEDFGVSGIPAFVKVDKDGNYIDLIDGGAWDANTPANMAPVLKKFVAGETAAAPVN